MRFLHQIFYSPSADGGAVISTEQMPETLAALEQAISAYETAQKKINASGEQLCNSWSGAGGKQFQEKFVELQLCIVEDLKELRHIRDRLSRKKALYEGADSTGYSLFHTIGDSPLAGGGYGGGGGGSWGSESVSGGGSGGGGGSSW